MSRSNKSKIAVTLLSALAFGANDASAMNSSLNTKSDNKIGFSTEKNSKSGAEIPKPRGTLNIRNDSSGNKIFNWVKNHKAVSIAAPLVTTGVVGFAIWGVKHKSKGDQGPSEQDPNKDLNKEKDNEQKPIISPNNLEPNINKNKNENIVTNTLQNIQNMSGPQNNNVHPLLQDQGINEQFVAQRIGQQNVQKFIDALRDAQQNGIKFPMGYIKNLLAVALPNIAKVVSDNNQKLQNFAALANLSQQNWSSLFVSDDNTCSFCIYTQEISYTICSDDEHQSVYFEKRKSNKWDLQDEMVIQDGVLTSHGLK